MINEYKGLPPPKFLRSLSYFVVLDKGGFAKKIEFRELEIKGVVLKGEGISKSLNFN